MKTLAVILAVVIAVAAASLIYPTTMEVIHLDGDDLYLMNATGHVYVMEGVEDYEVGDLVSLIMFSNDTPSIEDDIIISARYSGYTKGE